MEYKPTIGLEIHVELKTRTKMFCDSLNNADEKEPNRNTCPVCLGHPGTLPVPNKEAIRHVIRVGLALGGTINPVTKFDRKNYFYPDLPKGYQISQYDQPLVTGGNLLGVQIRRIHLEEDTGTLVHTSVPENENKHENDHPYSYSHPSRASLVDFNRSGVPLMELVTEPDITSAEQAAEFGKELQLILRYLGVSDADMEKGHLRIEANISLRPEIPNSKSQNPNELGTKVEIKNINSFKAMRGAVDYELTRQEEVLKAGKKVSQETRGWDEAKQKTVSQRSKEEAHDYRYFPEPDIPPFATSVFEPERLARELPELPSAKRTRFAKEYGLDAKQAELLISEPKLSEYFEESASELKSLPPSITNYQLLINYLTSDLRGLMGEKGIEFGALRVKPEHFAHLVSLAAEKKITSRQAKDMLRKMVVSDEDPEDILRDEAAQSVSDEGKLRQVVEMVLVANPQAIADYKKGKVQSLQFLVGKAMGELKGKGNPETLRKLFTDELKK
ncbi:MAG: Asp-tRNA(Asn)/Glu-tRNA(Gln) amidotransferase subunit GatB [Candidatus Liptonbacteria bacterium]|nr:Asp-tRNA(Asn)/Glu-tRNA(Gln) amidotransferase subunit GatB [Candidatus Liptonbacteria bacterium]